MGRASELIKEELKSGSKTWRELETTITEKYNIPSSTFARNLKTLVEKWREVREITVEDPATHRLIKKYKLVEPCKEILEEKVEKALSEFKEMEYMKVSLIDLANKVGEIPKKIEESAYRLASKYGLEIGRKSEKRPRGGTLLRAY